ncbi:MAG: ABC transporter substrate-binding protein [Clostridia bacterium]|nr:ABC transporter substrate-binding protein [Clostridia bacterium]
MKKALVILLSILLVAVAVCGCDRAGMDKPNKGTRVIAGDAVTLEILDRLGVDVIAVSNDGASVDEKYADDVKYPKIGIAMSPKYEDISLLNPSEFIMSDATEEAFGNIKASLQGVGVEPMLLDYNSIEGLKASIVRLGDYFDKQDKAQNILVELEAKERSIKDKIDAMENKPRVMILFGAPLGTASDSISVETNRMFGGSLITYMGATNVAVEAYESEKRGMFKPNDWDPMIDANPDYIFCIAHGSPEKMWNMYDGIWDTAPYSFMDAVINGNVYYLPSDVVNVICSFDYVDSMQYILDIFEGNIEASI